MGGDGQCSSIHRDVATRIKLLTNTHPVAGSSISIGTLGRSGVLMSKYRMGVGGVNIRRARTTIRDVVHRHKIGRWLVL